MQNKIVASILFLGMVTVCSMWPWKALLTFIIVLGLTLIWKK